MHTVLLPYHLRTHNTTSPGLDSRANQRNAYEHDRDRTDEGRKKSLEPFSRQTREEELEEGTDHGCSKHSSIGRKTVVAIYHHLPNTDLINGQEGEAGTHDAQDASTNVQLAAKEFLGEGELETRNIDKGADAAHDEGCGNGILLSCRVVEA